MSTVMSPMGAQRGVPTSRWHIAGPTIALLLLGLLCAYRDTALGMANIWWRSDTFMHASLVVPVVLWLVWRDRAALAVMAPSPSPAWLVGVGVAAAAWLVGELGDTNAITQLAMTAVLVMSVPAVLGHRIARRLMFPLGFLFFAVPIGEFTMPLLMTWTADFTVAALRLSGVPVYRESQQFIIPSGAWSVVEACSGVRYLIASVMVGTLFAYLNFNSIAKRWAFVGVSILTPVIANWVRAYLIVMIGHLSNNRLATGVDHVVYGWVFFVVVMGLMFAIALRWQDPIAKVRAEPASRAVDATPVQAKVFIAVAIGVLLLAALPQVVSSRADVRVDRRVADVPLRWDASALGPRWPSASAPPAVVWVPAFANPSARFGGAWSSGSDRVAVDIAYYRDQGGDHKLVSSLNALVRLLDPVWSQVESGTREVDIGSDGRGEGAKLTVRAARLAATLASRRQGDGLRVWQLYWVDDRLTDSDITAKALGALQRLKHGRDDGAAIFISTADDGSGAADRVLAGFVRDNLGAVTERLRATRDGR